MSYSDYLKSLDWQEKRSQKLNRKGGKLKRCAICASVDQLQVHHLIYRDRLEDANQNDLRVLCRECHQTVHHLHRQGLLTFANRNPNSRFTLTKTAVKKFKGLAGMNMFASPVEYSPAFGSPD
jgi:5-methylcytosine-specific restriction endonuclease McrA